MNTITGINSIRQKISLMLRFSGAVFFFLIACRTQNIDKEAGIVSRSDVMVTHPVIKDVGVFEEFQGVTRYMQTIGIRAHVTGIISKVNVSLSDRISAKQCLFEIKPHEAFLLESSNVNNEFIISSTDSVFAYISGIVNQINVQPGDFVQESDLLASCVDQHSLRVIVSVPLETEVMKVQNKPCTALFPDGSILSGTIGTILPTANETSQTNAFYALFEGMSSIPENIHVKVKVLTGSVKDGIFLPTGAVYGNEEQSLFWVLKIKDDTIALRVPVQKGIKDVGLVQVSGTGINISDRFVYDGGYAISDSALVNIVASN
jgi:multidrug efflux pump subunit AcrA (membrane-fusion protein)